MSNVGSIVCNMCGTWKSPEEKINVVRYSIRNLFLTTHGIEFKYPEQELHFCCGCYSNFIEIDIKFKEFTPDKKDIILEQQKTRIDELEKKLLSFKNWFDSLNIDIKKEIGKI